MLTLTSLPFTGWNGQSSGTDSRLYGTRLQETQLRVADRAGPADDPGGARGHLPDRLAAEQGGQPGTPDHVPDGQGPLLRDLIMNRMSTNATDETKELSVYLSGMADATDNERLERAADWLERLSDHVCGQGYIGCDGGRECSSDHK